MNGGMGPTLLPFVVPLSDFVRPAPGSVGMPYVSAPTSIWVGGPKPQLLELPGNSHSIRLLGYLSPWQ